MSRRREALGTEAAGPAASGRADRMRVRAAWMYYVEQMTQSDIAAALGIGRVRVVRLLAEARNRSEVRISVEGELAELTRLERSLETRFGFERAIVVPAPATGDDPSAVISSAIGAHLSEIVEDGMSIGLGWGRTLRASLPFVEPRPFDDLKVVSLLGGISQAHRFNPAEFAWRFAQLFDGDAFLLTAPAIVDSLQTKAALIERCGLDATLDLAQRLDLAILSVGGITAQATTFRTGYVSEAVRRSLQEAGAVGDFLFHFLDNRGALVDHPINSLVMSADMEAIRRTPKRVMASGGPDKVDILRASITFIRPTTLITDEASAIKLLDDDTPDPRRSPLS